MAVETTEYVKMLSRMIAAGGRRVGDADEPELAQFVELRAQLDEAILGAILAQREQLERSWQWVGDALGISRQAAQQRYGKKPKTPAPAAETDTPLPLEEFAIGA